MQNLLLFLITTVALSTSAGCANSEANSRTAARPDLVVVIVVDQLRPVEFSRIRGIRPDGGFARFNQGVIFERAFYEHAVTQTAPGHATIATGANPSVHGVIANHWYSKIAADGNMVPAEGLNTPHGRRTTITHPSDLRASTIGDSLMAASTGGSKVVAVSGKSRAAILLGGHAGKAYWYEEGQFTSSADYHDVSPNWLDTVNASFSSLVPEEWVLSQPASEYLREDNLPYEIPPGTMGNTFPHRILDSEDIRHSPFLDTLTLAVARAAVSAESLGRHKTTDLLLVGLSATDRAGHFFGPQSREMEDNLYRLDEELRTFIDWLDDEFSLSNVLIALTADHGADLVPEETALYGMPSRRLDMTEILADCARKQSGAADLPSPLYTTFLAPYVYVDSEHGELDPATRQNILASFSRCLMQVPGIDDAFASNTFSAEEHPKYAQYIEKSLFPERSGDIYVIQSPSTYMYHDVRAAGHGTTHPYDRHVPIAFYRKGICARQVWRAAKPESIASTLAHILSIPAPPDGDTEVLWEAISALSGNCEEGKYAD